MTTLTTDESNYTDTDDGNTGEALRPSLLKDRNFTPSGLQALRSRFRQIISTKDKVSSFRRQAKQTNSDSTRRLGRPDQDCGFPNVIHGLYIELSGLAHASITGTLPTESAEQVNEVVGSSHSPRKNAHEFTTARKPSTPPFIMQQEIQTNYETFLREKTLISLVGDNIDDSEAKEFEAVFIEVDEQEEQSWEDEATCDEDMNSDKV